MGADSRPSALGDRMMESSHSSRGRAGGSVGAVCGQSGFVRSATQSDIHPDQKSRREPVVHQQNFHQRQHKEDFRALNYR